MKKRFGKLVRDRVPDILRERNIIVNQRIMDDYEYKKELLYKLIEEAEEVRQAGYDQKAKYKIEEQIADLLEVLDWIVKAFGLDLKEIQNIKQIKKAEKGGFKKRIFLESVEYSSHQRQVLEEIE